MFFPSKNEITKSCPSYNSYTEPGIEEHEDHHETVADENLDHMKEGLQEVETGTDGATVKRWMIDISKEMNNRVSGHVYALQNPIGY